MNDSRVVIFPSIYSLNRLQILKYNIKKILKLQNQEFDEIKVEGTIIIVYANDPVFASSIISMLTGIDKVAIAKKVKGKFNIVTNEIVYITSDLLLNNERFHIKVGGNISKNTAKDIEIEATSSIIHKTKNRNIRPSNDDDKCDKVIYTHITNMSAYICIFVDDGIGGRPYNSQNDKIICCIYNEMSSITCLKCMKAGFEIKIIICYQNYSQLIKLVKIVNKITSKIPEREIELEFFKLDMKIKFLDFLLISNIILIKTAKVYNIKKIALTTSPNVCDVEIADHFTKHIYKNELVPLLPLLGCDLIINDNVNREVNKLLKLKMNNITNNSIHEKIAHKIFQMRRKIIIKNNINNTHNIIDELKN